MFFYFRAIFFEHWWYLFSFSAVDTKFVSLFSIVRSLSFPFGNPPNFFSLGNKRIVYLLLKNRCW